MVPHNAVIFGAIATVFFPLAPLASFRKLLDLPKIAPCKARPYSIKLFIHLRTRNRHSAINVAPKYYYELGLVYLLHPSKTCK
jgi:hypothetical protein